jgi:coenzyme Q-binding protein COQ10
MHCRTLGGFVSVFLLAGAIPNALEAEVPSAPYGGADSREPRPRPSSQSSAVQFSSSVDPKEGWKLDAGIKGVAIYSRAHAGSRLKEFRATGPIDAPTPIVHAVIDDFENYPSFMPYTTECRLIQRDGDSIVGYQRLSPKICADRDYTLRVWKKSWSTSDGLVFMSQWTQANELGPPEKKGVVRVKVCNGVWLLEPDGTGKTRATYSIYTDTGGMIPAFIANRASQMGISRLFTAVREQVKNPKYVLRAQL